MKNPSILSPSRCHLKKMDLKTLQAKKRQPNSKLTFKTAIFFGCDLKPFFWVHSLNRMVKNYEILQLLQLIPGVFRVLNIHNITEVDHLLFSGGNRIQGHELLIFPLGEKICKAGGFWQLYIYIYTGNQITPENLNEVMLKGL